MRRVSERILVILVLGWCLGAGFYLAWHDSLTTDEGIHAASGYLALTRHELRFDPEHPYLYKSLTALPLLLIHPHLPPDDAKLWEAARPLDYDSWRESRSWTDHWFYRSGNNADLMTLLIRIPGVLSFVGLVYLIYAAARRWFSPPVGKYTLILAAFNPILLGHGHLANNDVSLALAFLGALYGLWWYGERPSLGRAVWAGFLIGIAQVVKFSALLLIPIAIVWFFYLAVRDRQYNRHFGLLLITALVTWGVIWWAYWDPLLVSGGHLVLPNPAGLTDFLTPQNHLLAVAINKLSLFFPAEYMKGIKMLLFSSHYGRPAYLLGSWHSTGFWYYFPLLFFFKSPLVMLLLLGAGLIGLRRKPLLTWSPAQVLLALTTLISTVTFLTNKLDIGIRHASPLVALLCLYSGVVLAGLPRLKRFAAPLLILYCLPTIIWLPNILGYGNLVVQPLAISYRYFNDSNLDWGRGARQIAQYTNRLFLGETVYSNYFWNPYALGYYGLSTVPFNPARPPHDGIILIDATQLTFPEYSAFRALTPVAQLDGLAYYFRLR